MKLLYCPECGDIKKLTRLEIRYCKCGASFGRYMPDGWHAKIGGLTIPIGISNPDFRRALDRFSGEKETPFEAFVFPRNHPRIERIDNPDELQSNLQDNHG